MALRPTTTNDSANLFETQEETMNTTATETAAPASTSTASTAVAPAASTAVAAAKKFAPALTEFQNAIPIETIEGMGVGGLPRVTVDLGGFALDGDKPLGNQIKIQMLSWNNRYIVASGSTDAEAKEFFKVSYDGVTCTDGTAVDEYLKWLKEVKGYEKASKKTYIDLWGYLIAANGKDLAEDDCKTVQVQVAPFSVSKFHAYQLDAGIRASRGGVVNDVVVINAERGKMGTNNFGYCSFSAK